MRTFLNTRHEPGPALEGRARIEYVGDSITISFDHPKVEDQKTLVMMPTEKEAFMLAGFFQALGTDLAIRRRK
jgi:hypothetical protein